MVREGPGSFRRADRRQHLLVVRRLLHDQTALALYFGHQGRLERRRRSKNTTCWGYGGAKETVSPLVTLIYRRLLNARLCSEVSRVLIHLILTTLGGEDSYYFCFTDEETEA